MNECKQRDEDAEVGRLVRAALAGGSKMSPCMCVTLVRSSVGKPPFWLASVEEDFAGRYPQGQGETYLLALRDLVEKLEVSSRE